jgi:hypothetical protein
VPATRTLPAIRDAQDLADAADTAADATDTGGHRRTPARIPAGYRRGYRRYGDTGEDAGDAGDMAEDGDAGDTADAGGVVHLRMQAGFPVLAAHEDSDLDGALALLLGAFEDWADRVETMSDGAIVVDILPCCETAATGSVYEAVSLGEDLDGAQGLAAYLYNDSSRLRRAAGLFGGYGEFRHEAFLVWMERGAETL